MESLKKNVSELITILKREIRSFNTILELMILQEKSLVACNRKELTSVLERLEDLLSSIACLEKSRIDIMHKISSFLNTDPENLTVSQIAHVMDEPYKNELEETALILAGLNEDIQRKKTSNALLINQSIFLVESNIRMILEAVNHKENKDVIYTHKAKSGEVLSNVCLDETM